MRPSGRIVRCHSRIATAVAIGVVAECSRDTPTAPTQQQPPPALTQLPRPLSTVEQQLVTGSNGFAFSLFHAVDSAAGPDSNVFISPLSASMALGMAAAGAAGATLDSMRAVLGYRDLPVDQMAASYHSLITLLQSLDPAVDFRIANSVWYDRSLAVLPSFVTTVGSDFEAPVTATHLSDPAAEATINQWVDSATSGRIPTLLDRPLPPSSVMFLANAVYFHGSWREQFGPAQTWDTLFTTRSGSTVPVRLMHREMWTRMSRTPRYTAVDLPYGRDAYVMTVIVPAAGVPLDSIVTALRDGEWAVLTDMHSDGVAIDLPKFQLTWGDSLNVPLGTLGMGIAFNDAADFSNMVSTPVKISQVLQKTFVNVDEEGTRAAAVTGVVGKPTLEPFHVRADHPFVYVLRERLSGTILFVGAFAHPPAE